MRRYLYFLSLTLLLIPFVGLAQEPIELSLEDAVEYSLKNNTTIKNARLDVLIQQAKNDEITGLAYPKINGVGNYQDFLEPVKSFLPGEFLGQPAGTFVPVQFTPKYTTNASVTANQILFDGSVLVALQAKKTVMRLMELNANLSEEEVKLNVQKSYYSLVVAQKQFEILKSSLANARDLANDVRIMKETGFVEKIELDRTTVQVNNLATDSIRIASLLELTEQILKYRMAMPLNQPIVLTDTSLEGNLEESLNLINSTQEYSNRIEYNLAQTQLRLNEYDLKRHRLSALPSLSTFINGGYNYSTGNFNELFQFRKNYQFSSMWGLQLNVPIFDGLQRRNRVKQARLTIEQTKNNIDELTRSIDFQTAQSQTSLRNALLAVQSQQRNQELAGTVLDLAQRKYREGVGSNLEVTQAQSDFLQAQNNYFQAMLEAVNAQADLQRALGTLK